MKVIINRCYGGYNLSIKALYEYTKRTNGEAYVYVSDDNGYHYTTKYIKTDIDCHNTKHHSSVFVSKKDLGDCTDLSDKYNEKDTYIVNGFKIDRNDSVLVDVVEELGKEADGFCSELKVVEIPDDVEYEILDYDGLESIHEKHRVWV